MARGTLINKDEVAKILFLHFEEGLVPKEIARRIDRAPSTVRNIINKHKKEKVSRESPNG